MHIEFSKRLTLRLSLACALACPQLIMVATGVLTAVNPDRIILKKVMLTGYPVRARKRFAVVKYMFFDPLDVKVRGLNCAAATIFVLGVLAPANCAC